MTNNPTPEQMRKDRAMDVDEVVPSLADREAAAEATNPPDGWNPSEWAAEIIARHRIAARKQALEEAAAIAKTAWVSAHYDVVGITDADMAMRLCEHSEQSIRALSDSHVDQD